MFGDTSGDSERARRLEAEVETDRELSEGAPAHQSWLERWRASRRKRHHERSEAGTPGDEGGPAENA